jgi:hypothetical protein
MGRSIIMTSLENILCYNIQFFKSHKWYGLIVDNLKIYVGKHYFLPVNGPYNLLRKTDPQLTLGYFILSNPNAKIH